jgi:hypothetical protein
LVKVAFKKNTAPNELRFAPTMIGFATKLGANEFVHGRHNTKFFIEQENLSKAFKLGLH